MLLTRTARTKKGFLRYSLRLVCWLLITGTASARPNAARPDAARPFLQKLEKASPADRIILILNHFDSNRAIIQNEALATRTLEGVDSLGKRLRDDQLRRYGRYLRATYAKHQQTNARNAALFLAVGQQAEADDDPQIAAVCRHFAGQYFFLNEEYGNAFEHLLAANKGFRAIGYGRIPEISRYLYELAFNYFYFNEDEKTIGLLREAARYPPFNNNLAIQTFNTMGLAHQRLSLLKPRDHLGKAEACYLQTRQTALHYRDSLWVGIAQGNLAVVYEQQQKFPEALAAVRSSYDQGKQFGDRKNLPYESALSLARLYFQLQRLDSCGHFLRESAALYRRNRATVRRVFGDKLADEQYLRNYADVARQYHRAVGNLPRAYSYLDSMSRLDARINQRFNSDQLSLVNQKLLIQKHQSEVEKLETEKATGQTRTWVVGGVLTLVALLFFLLYRFVRVRRRQESLLNAEREKSLRLEKQLVEDELERSQADLSLFMDNLRQKNALIDAISAELEERGPTRKPGGEPLLREVVPSLVNSSLLTNDDWDEFQRRFERVHPRFFAQLKHQFSDISPAEERLMALSKLGINTRQMSRMLGISPASIRTTKYRLLKKLGVDGHSSLAELLGEPSDEPSIP